MVAKVITQAQVVYHTLLTGMVVFLFAVSPLVPLIWNGMIERAVMLHNEAIALPTYSTVFWTYMIVPTIALIAWVNTEVNWKRREENFKKWLARHASV